MSESLNVAVEWVVRMLHRVTSHTSTMVPLEEAKFNNDGGVGLPYKLTSFTQKQDFLDRCPELLNGIVEEAKGEYDMMWDCFPKVEILPMEKAKEKTRIICGSPVEHFLIGAMLYSEFNERLASSPLSTFSCIGFVPSHGGWSKLFNKLPALCENADATRFDKTISPKLLKLVYMVRAKLSSYSEGELFVHWWYFRQLVKRKSFTSNGSVYNVHGGNGSGQYNTTTDNTIAYMLALAYAAHRSGYDYRWFRNLRVFVYGDDYIGEALPPHFWDRFVELGFVLKKTPHQSKFQCDFLSHKFVKTAWGVTATAINDKALYSCYTSESKNWRLFLAQKLYSLWLENYFNVGVRDAIEECMMYYRFPFRPYEAIDYWFGRLGGFKNQYG